MKQCIYAGAFDPPHLGHENIINRLLKTFDSVTVAVLNNAQKRPVLEGGARARLLQTVYADEPRVIIRTFDGLLTDFARTEGIFTIARGLRNAEDFAYENSLSAVYKSQNPKIEVVFLAADPALAHISSSTVRELTRLGGDVSDYVPGAVMEEIKRSYK